MSSETQTPAGLGFDFFGAACRQKFRFQGARHALTLDRVIRERETHAGGRQPFTLIFRGPKQRDVLPEGFYECDIEGGPSVDLYVGPIHTPAPDRQDYQAVFN